MWRSTWLVMFLGVGCVCGGPDQPDGAVDAGVRDGGRSDAGIDGGGGDDAGFDAGSDAGDGRDAGRPDGGSDAGRPDGGGDGGFDGGGLTEVTCAPWQTCVEAGGGARCTGTVTIAWVSPVAGASAPLDLEYVPLAIDTNASAATVVPWSASGVLSAAGVFSGQVGVRSATLLLADSDAGVVVLTAGWDGGPQATTTLQLERPIVRVPPAPSYGTTSADFEPNDPAGPAFRRDDRCRSRLTSFHSPWRCWPGSMCRTRGRWRCRSSRAAMRGLVEGSISI